MTEKRSSKSIAELRERFRAERITDMGDSNSARLSAVEFLLAHFEPMRCDSEGMSDCVRCNAVALARWMLKDLRAAVESHRESPDAD